MGQWCQTLWRVRFALGGSEGFRVGWEGGRQGGGGVEWGWEEVDALVGVEVGGWIKR